MGVPANKTRRLFQRPLLFAAETTGALVDRPPPGLFSFAAVCYYWAANMKTLFLLRHAHAENPGPGSSDLDRALDERGRKEARAAGIFIKQLNLKFGQVLCSTAVRARETTDILIAAAELQASVRYDQRIYEAASPQLLEVIREVEDEKGSLLVVGHNPGMEELIKLLTAQIVPMSTCTLAKIDLEGDQWSNIREAGGSLDWTVKPEKLPVS
jgi:phosphohistidine phosphatase